MPSHSVKPKKIHSIEEIAENIFLLSFTRDFKFSAGQVIGLALKENGPRRLYSICSGEKEDLVSILFNVIEEGYLTPRLSDLDEGDIIWVTEPRGEFLYDPAPAFWIASGTGIAPFYSMFKTNQRANKILLHGERYLEKFYFFDEFHPAMDKDYIRCCSGEEHDEVYHGRVTDYLKEAPFLPTDYKYYLCGRAEMVVEARDILIERNIPYHQIISEIYF